MIEQDEQRDHNNEPSSAVSMMGGTANGPTCLHCGRRTFGACLVCSRPLCEGCGAWADELLRWQEHLKTSYDERLWQAALNAVLTSKGVKDVVVLSNTVLQEISAALLRWYAETFAGSPSPAQIQQMRRLALSV